MTERSASVRPDAELEVETEAAESAPPTACKEELAKRELVAERLVSRGAS
jgi:hypothetical protein